MLKISPSILNADFMELGRYIKDIEEGGADYLHLDIMDGRFVPNISFGVPVIEAARSRTDLIFDTHLMIEEPERFIEQFAKAGSDIITVHAEACTDIDKTLYTIHKYGKKAGIAICPSTPVESIQKYFNKCELVLIMSVNPGFGGQQFDKSTFDKLKQTRALLDELNPNADVEVDGGVKLYNAADIIRAGANVLVAGTAILKGNIKENIDSFKKVME